MRYVKNNKKTLFSQCDVVIQRIEDPSIKTYSILSHCNTIKESVAKIKDERVVGKTGRRGSELKCISPLGFYYTKSSYYGHNDVYYKEVGTREKFIINFDGGYYEISYLRSMNGVSIGHETRPWDLIGNGMSDHFIHDLEKVMNGIVEFLYTNKDYQKNEIEGFKNHVFTSLFGSPDGIKTQTNDGKILSHGFDLKYSFRKRKES